ncbi:MAG: TonB family protein [Bacteroidaceae bacterium]|nr:TonB family protein [Bacteroidaceae bacterium]
MNILTYIIFVQLGITTLYLLYKLFLSGDTFLHAHRYTLLGGVIFAFIYPLACFHIPREGVEALYNNINVRYGVELSTVTVGVERMADSFMLIDLYYIGVVLGFLLLVIRVLSLLYLRMHSDSRMVMGIKVCVPHVPIKPFSFASVIYMNVDRYDPAMLRDILLHEKAHVRGCHTIDLIVGEIMVIMGWFNPFSWLLRQEFHSLVEYLADADAVKDTFSIRGYQYHLLQSVQGGSDGLIGIHFNQKMLVERIKKINQPISRLSRRLLYIILLPVSFMLIFAAHAGGSLYQYTMHSLSDKTELQENVATNYLSPQEVTASSTALPQFPGGDIALNKFVADNIKYPPQAVSDKVEGMVMVRFIINSEGYVVSPTILRGLTPECDAEVLRIVGLMPRWQPSVQDGIAVDVDFVLPITFKL